MADQSQPSGAEGPPGSGAGASLVAPFHPSPARLRRCELPRLRRGSGVSWSSDPAAPSAPSVPPVAQMEKEPHTPFGLGLPHPSAKGNQRNVNLRPPPQENGSRFHPLRLCLTPVIGQTPDPRQGRGGGGCVHCSRQASTPARFAPSRVNGGHLRRLPPLDRATQMGPDA